MADGMNPMRILWVTSVFHPEPGGGSGVHVYNCVKALAARGHLVTVLAARTMKSTPSSEVWPDGTAVVRYPGKFENPWRGMKAAEKCYRSLRKLDRQDFDVLICGSLYSDLAAFKWNARTKLPCLYFFYGPMDLEYGTEILGILSKRGPWLKYLMKYIISPTLGLMKRKQAKFIESAHVTATLSRHSQEIIRGHFGLNPCRAVLISGGADHTVYTPIADRDDLKRNLGYHSADPLILTVRRLIPRTGVDKLIGAMPAIAVKYPQALLLIAGDGALKEELEERVKVLGLHKNVKFLGYVSEFQKVQLYQAADISIVPTASLEGFGLSIAESLACGTPVLGTPVGSIPEILEPLNEGLVFKSAGAEDIADGIVAFLNERKSTNALREKSVLLAREHYCWDAAAKGIEQALSSFMGKQ
jgi:glycosyltransferase involved in cell wall biosynthesis